MDLDGNNANSSTKQLPGTPSGPPPAYDQVVAEQPRPGGQVYVVTMGVPPGIQALENVDILTLEEHENLKQILFNFKTQNKLEVIDSLGRSLFYFVEKSSTGQRYCFGAARSYTMTGYDLYNNKAIYFERILDCTGCCSANQVFNVYSPPDNMIGLVEQVKNVRATYSIKDGAGNKLFTIKGDLKCCAQSVWTLYEGDEAIGGLTVYHKYKMSFDFPIGLPPWKKVLILGAFVFLKSIFYDHPRS